MFNKHRLLALALGLALFVYCYGVGGWKLVVNQTILFALILMWFSGMQALVKQHDVDSEAGWKKLGPSWSHWCLVAMPIFIAVYAAIVMAVNHFIFGVALPDYPANLFNERPLLAVLGLIVFLLCVCGASFGWAWRLRWTELGIERRTIFFQTKWIAWSDIVSVGRRNWLGLVTANLSDGTHVSVATSRAGFAELEKDARLMKVVLDDER